MTDRDDRLFEQFRRTRAPAALAELFDRTATDLLRIALHLCGRTADAEDALQATFVIAIERADTWDSARGLFPWLTGILVHEAARHRRERSRAAKRRRRPEPAAGRRGPARARAHARSLRRGGARAGPQRPRRRVAGDGEFECREDAANEWVAEFSTDGGTLRFVDGNGEPLRRRWFGVKGTADCSCTDDDGCIAFDMFPGRRVTMQEMVMRSLDAGVWKELGPVLTVEPAHSTTVVVGAAPPPSSR